MINYAYPFLARSSSNIYTYYKRYPFCLFTFCVIESVLEPRQVPELELVQRTVGHDVVVEHTDRGCKHRNVPLFDPDSDGIVVAAVEQHGVVAAVEEYTVPEEVLGHDQRHQNNAAFPFGIALCLAKRCFQIAASVQEKEHANVPLKHGQGRRI